MRAAVLPRHGGPEVFEIQDRPEPSIGPGRVRIRVRAAGINFADLMARQGIYPDAPDLPSLLGSGVAGEVDELGRESKPSAPATRSPAGAASEATPNSS